MNETLKTALFEQCSKNQLTEAEISEYSLDLVLDKYPYAPYIPDNWNGYLAIAEAQQLRRSSTGNSKYVDDLLSGNTEQLIFRLNNEKFNKGKVGITPWDDGFIKIAIKSCFPEININQVAVANAIPWSLNKLNTKQDKFLIERSKKYWKEILELLKGDLKCVVRTGEYARNILAFKELKDINIEKVFSIRSASQLERVSSLFNWEDLLKRYPEVKNAMLNSGYSIDDENNANLIFYAAHAVSTINK